MVFACLLAVAQIFDEPKPGPYPEMPAAIAKHFRLTRIAELLPNKHYKLWDRTGKPIPPDDFVAWKFGDRSGMPNRRSFVFKIEWVPPKEPQKFDWAASLDSALGCSDAEGSSTNGFLDEAQWVISKDYAPEVRRAEVRFVLVAGPADKVYDRAVKPLVGASPERVGFGWLRPQPSDYWVYKMGPNSLAKEVFLTGFAKLKSGKSVPIQGTRDSRAGPELGYFAVAANVLRNDPPVRLHIVERRYRQIVFHDVPLKPNP